MCVCVRVCVTVCLSVCVSVCACVHAWLMIFDILFLSRMTKFDIRNYFEKIYGVKVAKVNTRIQLGTLLIFSASVYK